MRKFILLMLIQRVLPRVLSSVFRSRKVREYSAKSNALSKPARWATEKRSREWEGIVGTALFLGTSIYSAFRKRK